MKEKESRKNLQLIWDNVAYEYFERHIMGHHGEVLKAIYLISVFLNDISEGIPIVYRKNGNEMIISDKDSFEKNILNKLSEDVIDILDWVKTFNTFKKDDPNIARIMDDVYTKVIRNCDKNEF